MTNRPKVIVDPHFRSMAEIFTGEDRARLDTLATVVWGKDEPMPADAFDAAIGEAEAVVCADWRYGEAALKTSGAAPGDPDRLGRLSTPARFRALFRARHSGAVRRAGLRPLGGGDGSGAGTGRQPRHRQQRPRLPRRQRAVAACRQPRRLHALRQAGRHDRLWRYRASTAPAADAVRRVHPRLRPVARRRDISRAAASRRRRSTRFLPNRV